MPYSFSEFADTKQISERQVLQKKFSIQAKNSGLLSHATTLQTTGKFHPYTIAETPTGDHPTDNAPTKQNIFVRPAKKQTEVKPASFQIPWSNFKSSH